MTRPHLKLYTKDQIQRFTPAKLLALIEQLLQQCRWNPWNRPDHLQGSPAFVPVSSKSLQAYLLWTAAPQRSTVDVGLLTLLLKKKMHIDNLYTKYNWLKKLPDFLLTLLLKKKCILIIYTLNTIGWKNYQTFCWLFYWKKNAYW